MSLHVEHLNADATFLLTFRPPTSRPSSESSSASSTGDRDRSYTILLDPWLHSDAPVIHPKFSNQEHTVPARIASLRSLETPPDIIIASQDKSDHLHEGTLKDYDWEGTPTELIVVPDAIGIVRSWKWFPQDRVRVLDKTLLAEGEFGIEVKMELMKPRIWEIPSLHSAIAIKFSYGDDGDTAFNVLFTPHGSPMSAVGEWLKCLPERRGRRMLDLLMHPWVRVETPMYLGGLISSGFPAGRDICRAVEVRTWVGTHDEKKKVTGFVAKRITKRIWGKQEVEMGCDGVRVVELGVGREMVVEMETTPVAGPEMVQIDPNSGNRVG